MNEFSSEFTRELFRILSGESVKELKKLPEYSILKEKLFNCLFKNILLETKGDLEFLGYAERDRNVDFCRIILFEYIIYFEFGVEVERVIVFNHDSDLIHDTIKVQDPEINYEKHYIDYIEKKINCFPIRLAAENDLSSVFPRTINSENTGEIFKLMKDMMSIKL